MNVPEAIEVVCKEIHLPMVESAFGQVGLDAAFQIMTAAKSLYMHVELERVAGQVIIFQTVQPQCGPSVPSHVPAVDFASLANLTITDLIFEIASDGLPYSRTLPTAGLEDLSKTAVIYHWQGGAEEFLAGGERRSVPRLDQATRSQFAVPTFSNLRDALQHYATANVRESTCYIFRTVWHGDNRLFLRAKPEATMRRSLTQFLRNRMSADHDVWPEQNVDESHPVDIRVQPRFNNNRLMLIEIKWLGCSVAEDGHITACHKNPRAQDGADQLSVYLDEQRQSAPNRVIQGYYVIVDCRRENLQEGAITISQLDGMFYEHRDLTFSPAHHETRNDFDPPYRMFARPIHNG